MRLLPIAFALFIFTPLLEIYLFIKVGAVIGAFQTVLLIVITAVVGVSLLRYQGIATFRQVQQQLQQGELPAVSMIEGMLLLFAGALLLTPGFFTDALGFLILLPPLRKAVAIWFLQRSGTIVRMRTQSRSGGSRQQDYIEGEFKRRDDE